jgi:hypothetical protein
MNRVSQQIIAAFLSRGNREYLRAAIAQMCGPAAQVFLARHFDDALGNFAFRMERDLFGSDPITQVAQQVAVFNAQFISDTCAAIGPQQTPITFTIGDGHCTAKGKMAGKNIAQMAPTQMLDSWKDYPARQVVLRDDTDNIYDSVYGSKCGIGPGGNGPKCKSCGPAPSNYTAGQNEGFVDGVPGEDTAGMQFGDMSSMGVNQYYSDYMAQPFIQNLNRGPLWGTSAFGNAIEDEDLKAFTRRTFRANEDGVENGIPKYRTWLHHRNYERDVAETFRAGGERGFMQRGHDNSTLIARVNAKRAIAGEYRMQGTPMRGTIDAPVTNWRL